VFIIYIIYDVIVTSPLHARDCAFTFQWPCPQIVQSFVQMRGGYKQTCRVNYGIVSLPR